MTQKIIKLLPLIILIVVTIILLVTVMTTDVSLMKQHILGLVLLAIATTSQFLNEKIGYQWTGGILLIGTFAFAGFTPTLYIFSLNFGSYKISFDELCTPILLIYIFVHRKEIPNWISELLNINDKKIGHPTEKEDKSIPKE